MFIKKVLYCKFKSIVSVHGFQSVLKKKSNQFFQNFPIQTNPSGFPSLNRTFEKKFPLLEFVGKELYFKIPEMNQIYFMDQIIKLGHMWVVTSFPPSFFNFVRKNISNNLLIRYILLGNEWYVCDIIGERIMSYFLLKEPERTFPILKKYVHHENDWFVR
ncbi:hypothetical protein LEP1GSC021_2643 [Leptospira noguchii str. 1993005606]|uniref:Uncharacterized protein n=2 Tax=Leptospira noguchii TaxID=28182 RepID=M6Y308_9LEPT|nr:hypothetical protein LEP1GSC035_2353 [Leptospira noguchii str. 2007001578]EMO88065.1 hypothetical protein LEP1GSC024_0388 [Leptospira noguchii str. 2001034031]EPE85252.1 hypothetical protein LEP1GSC021_2643 [Leptospira noguchii str. 1993005606]